MNLVNLTSSRLEASSDEYVTQSHKSPDSENDNGQQDNKGDRGDRIVNICEIITPTLANRVILELLQYNASAPDEPIHMFIFSPGGCVVSGLAIVDAMEHITAPVFTYSIGFAASMGAVILAAGQKGHRYILPRSRVMIHQARGSAGGTLDNLRATLAHQIELESDIEEILARASGHTLEEIRDALKVDNWLKAQTAVDFGLVDHVLSPATSLNPDSTEV